MPATLTVPWSKGLIPHRRYDDYKITLVALPTVLGKVTVIHKYNVPKRSVQTVWGGWHYLSSADDAGGDDHKDVPYVESPHPGWNVIKGTHRFEFGDDHGDWSYDYKSEDGNRVQYNVTTIHHGVFFGTSGRVRFRIGFDEEYLGQQEVSDTLQLTSFKWGDSKSLPYKAGSWIVIYDGFNGSKNEFTTSGTWKYIKVISDGENVRILAVDPNSVSPM